ncbi:hypothetical protein KIN34_03535 [Cellulomonas sp. DKR-3]|uniref:Uncharacterized protein n=1 Tax=Cellulomonas fulva TaxID=2835530 RepID=A0ABS5TW43_9CELL|nr:hypothetical protein [Cellulomonas fulva]MBT0993356.1 hypothetical protein [Cellulomonas fulva]
MRTVTGTRLATVTVLAPAPQAGTFAREWGVAYLASDEHGRALGRRTAWCGAEADARELLGASAGQPGVHAPTLVHRWVSAERTGEPEPLPDPWEVVDTLVSALARATGQQEAVVRLGIGVA